VGGWGWCALNNDNSVLGAECGTLEGDEQTVPRAELRAVLSILERVPKDAKITIKVDASYLLGFRSDPEAKCRSDNGEMWLECWRLIISKRINLSVVKIARSHASDAMVTAGIISERDRPHRQ
jgi:ribonuclease HI